MKSDPRVLKRIPSLDGLRAFAIIIVLVGHASHAAYFPWKNWRFDLLANAGVRVFFVLSGFLITALLLKERKQRGTIFLKEFYVRRAYRILPAFYLYLLFITALALIHLISMPRRDLFCAYMYLSNFRPGQHHLTGHLWSLSVEEQFYLLWPFATAFLLAKKRNATLFLAVAIPPVLRCIMSLQPSLAPYVDQSFFTICDTLAIGCLLAVYRTELHAAKLYQRLLSKRGVAIIIFCCLLLLESAKFSPFVYQITQSVLNIAIALLLDAFVALRPRFLNNRPVILLGTWSYSIYLWQQIFCSSRGHWWEVFPLNIALSIMVGYCSYRWVEQPFMRLRKNREKPQTLIVECVG